MGIKIKLIKLPNVQSNKGVLMPDLGIGILVTILKKSGFDVSQLDLKPLFYGNKSGTKFQCLFGETIEGVSPVKVKQIQELSFSFAKDTVKKHSLSDYDCLGFSLDEETDLLFNLNLIKTFKLLTGKIIIIGGGFRFGRSIMEKYGFVDFLIRGDATFSLKQLLIYLGKRRGNLSQIPGLHYRQAGKFKNNPYLRQAGNVNLVPDFSDLDMEDYRLGLSECGVSLSEDKFREIHNPELKVAILPYHFIKGCPNACSYCYWNREKLFKVTQPERVVDNLQFMKEKYRVNHFLFLNNSFNPTLKYGEEFVKSLERRKLGILWSDSAHPATISKDFFPALKASGCVQLYYGLESLSKRILKMLNRSGDPADFSMILRESHRHDIFNGVNFIVGIPFEKEEDIKLTHDFIKKNKKYFEYFNINLLRIIPEFGFSKKPMDVGISLRRFGCSELRNPVGDPIIKQVLESAGISKGTAFYSFDEIGGIGWEQKNKQDIKSIKYLIRVSDSRKKEFFEDIRFIFYLSRAFRSKREILQWYKK